MRKKQSLQHFDQRQLLLLENAYYQVGLPFVIRDCSLTCMP
jgi:regulator of nonsense transcripts 2